jgi:hypothetical protein
MKIDNPQVSGQTAIYSRYTSSAMIRVLIRTSGKRSSDECANTPLAEKIKISSFAA